MRIFNEFPLGGVSLKGEKTEAMPMWSINYYIQELCNNYGKLIIIERICELSKNSEAQFFAAKQSASLFPRMTTSKSLSQDNLNYIRLSQDGDTADKFWHIIESYTRPNVFVKYNKSNNDMWPIYDFTYSEAIKINKLIYNSPINIDAQGALNALIDLAEAKSKHEMLKEEHANKQINQSAINYISIVRAGQIVNDPKTPEWIRQYANNGLIQLLEKQGKLNERLGIRLERVDERR